MTDTIVTPNLADAVTSARTFAAEALASAAAANTSAVGASTAAVTAFNDRFRPNAASDPSVRPSGGPNQLGDIYFNTNAEILKMYLGVGPTGWIPVAISISAGVLLAANNLSDVADAGISRTNLGILSAALHADTFFLQAGNNLSDITNAATARTNLALADIANTGSATDLLSGTVPAACLPNPGVSALGGVKSASAPSNQFQTGIDTSGNPTFARPALSNLTGAGTAASHNIGDFLQPSNNLSDVSNAATALINLGAASFAGLFGDGSDGDVTVSGSVTLSRDMYYHNLTIQAGAAINTKGYRIFVSGTLDISAAPAGSFIANGGDASAGTVGTQATSGTIGGSGNAGVAGKTTDGVGTSPSNQTANGGAGGTGGASSGHAGGSAPTATKAPMFPASIFSRPGLDYSTESSPAILPGGIGGACGGATLSGAGSSGAGGAGGGAMLVYAAIIARGTNANTGIFQIKGGAGGSAASPATFSDNVGGGGGGGGGYGLFVYRSVTGSSITNAIDVSGGAGGNANRNGSGTCVGGSSGSSGGVWLVNFGTGTVTVTLPVAGSAGSSGSPGTGASANTKRVAL